MPDLTERERVRERQRLASMHHRGSDKHLPGSDGAWTKMSTFEQPISTVQAGNTSITFNAHSGII